MSSLGLAFGHAPAKVSAAQAKKTVLARYHGKVLGKVVYEREDGRMQYAIMVRTGKVLREVNVDAKTGKITNVEITTMAKEGKEAKAEKKGKKDND